MIFNASTAEKRLDQHQDAIVSVQSLGLNVFFESVFTMNRLVSCPRLRTRIEQSAEAVE